MTDSQQVLQSEGPHPDFNIDQRVGNAATTANGTTIPPPPHTDGLERQEAEGLEEECDDRPPITGRTLGYWLTLVFFVGPFYVIPPLSWAYTVYVAVRLGQAWKHRVPLLRALSIWQWVLLSYTVFECIFSIYYYFLCRKISRRESQVPKRNAAELRLAIQRLLEDDLDYHPAQETNSPVPPKPATTGETESSLFTASSPPPPRLAHDDPRAVDFRNHFRLWFRGIPWGQISRQNMRDWFAWSLFDLYFDKLDEAQKSMVEEAVVLIECRTGCSLEDDKPGEEDAVVDVMRLTSDPIVTWTRPGLLYVLGGVMNFTSELWLKWKYGMVKREFAGIEYLIREGSPSSDSEQPPDFEPIILLHGLGFGLLQYFNTIVYILNRIPAHQPLVVPLNHCISQSIWHPSHLEPMSRDGWVQGLKGLIEKHGWDGDVAMISHSKGSYIHTWMLKEYPELVKRSCFTDPVCFCIWEGDLCWNFVYRTPRDTWQLIIKYFAATEPGISLVVQRHFDWVANALWIEEIPHSTEPYYTSFLLGGLDVVINTARVRRYLEKHGIREGIHWNPRGHHAQAAIGWTGLQNIVNWLLMPRSSSVPPASLN